MSFGGLTQVRPATTIVRNELDAPWPKRMSPGCPAAVLALVLAGLGVWRHGIRRQPAHARISVRMALGASQADVLRLLVKDSLRPVIIGLVVRLAAALVGSRISASCLRG